MVLWIVIAAVLVGLLVLVLSAGSLAGRLRPLRRAATTLLRRQAEAEKLQVAAATLARRPRRCGSRWRSRRSGSL